MNAGSVAVEDGTDQVAVDFDIPSQALETALIQFAEQADMSVLVQHDEASGVISNSLKGRYFPLDGLAVLMLGTELEYRSSGSGVIVYRPVARLLKHPKPAETPPAATGPSWVMRVGAALASVLIGGAGHAQDGSSGAEGTGSSASVIEEILVTARRREESLQDVPVAISAFTGSDLERKQILNPTELMFHTPSLTMTTRFGTLYGGFAVRGLSGGTTTYFAEAPMGPTNASNAFFDIESVQVLNGPQGTQFGRANTAGAVLIMPNTPDLTRVEGEIRGKAGNHGRAEITGVINIPIVADQLAFRLAANHSHTDGYTSLIGSSQSLSEADSNQIRASLTWSPGDGGFRNTTILNYYDVNQDPGTYVLAAYNPNLAVFNLPPSIDAPLGGVIGDAVFGAICDAAVAQGLAPTKPECIDQRLQIMSTFKSDLEAEVARVESGDSQKWRTLGPTPDLDLNEQTEQLTVINTTWLDFGKLGPTTLDLKNIFGYERSTGVSTWMAGFGGRILPAVAVPSQAGNITSTRTTLSVSGNQTGNQVFAKQGPDTKFITEELQLRGDVGDGRFNWLVGGYYEKTEAPTNLEGVRNMFRLWEGVFSPNLGWNVGLPFSDGGYYEQKAVFLQGSLELGDLVPGIKGLQVSGGYRRTWDDRKLEERAAVLQLPSGNYVPGDLTSTKIDSKGNSYSFSIDAELTDNLMVYLAAREGYRPGGINAAVTGGIDVPNFQPVYDPETVRDWELGAKLDFATDSVDGRINVALYRAKYKDIQRQLVATSGGRVVPFLANVAEATLEGIELQMTLASGPLTLDVVYSYGDAGFDEWVGSDPLSLIGPGDPQCLPESTPELCLLDLSGNKFPNAPKHQGTATISYTLPLASRYGSVTASFTAILRSRTYLVDDSERQIDLFGEEIRDVISQPSYERYDARVLWERVLDTNFDAALFGTNLSDEAYALASLNSLTSFGTSSKVYAAPRMYGVELTYTFGR